MRKVLFLIHDLGQGGAEKVLVNLVNNMDDSKFDITVMTLFDVGVNRQFLNSNIKYQSCFSRVVPGNSHLMKLLTSNQLHRRYIKEKYDIEISYLEGPSTRMISGCPWKDTKKIAWVHCTMKTQKDIACGYRSFKEAQECYRNLDLVAFVSKDIKNTFLKQLPLECATKVVYNTNDSERILTMSEEIPQSFETGDGVINWCGVGKLTPNKGFDRMLYIQKRLIQEGYKTHLHIIGDGQEKERLEEYCKQNNIRKSVTFWGYQTNPYKYIANCDLFVCASHSEGFSTAATEALIVGTPICTVEVSGMKELLGANNEHGIVVENNDEALYQGIKKMVGNGDLLNYYKERAKARGKDFKTHNTVAAVEEMLVNLAEGKI